MNQLTLKDLKKAVDLAIKEGHGDKKIILSNDDEGNGVHQMFYLISDHTQADYFGYDPKEYIHLG